MYSRKTSSGSWPTRSAAVGDAADRPGAGRGPRRGAASAASISPGSTISSASSSGCSSEPERIAWRARRSPTKRGSRRFAAPGMIPSLRAGSVQRQCRARTGCGRRTAAAGSRRRSRTSRRRRSTACRAVAAPEDLVDEPEVADREEQVGDLAAVEVGEVQAGAEDPAAGVARVLDDAAAQHADLDLVVEQQRGRSPPPAARCVVSSSALRWRGLRSSTMPTVPRALDVRLAEVDRARRA